MDEAKATGEQEKPVVELDSSTGPRIDTGLVKPGDEISPLLIAASPTSPPGDLPSLPEPAKPEQNARKDGAPTETEQAVPGAVLHAVSAIETAMSGAGASSPGAGQAAVTDGQNSLLVPPENANLTPSKADDAAAIAAWQAAHETQRKELDLPLGKRGLDDEQPPGDEEEDVSYNEDEMAAAKEAAAARAKATAANKNRRLLKKNTTIIGE